MRVVCTLGLQPRRPVGEMMPCEYTCLPDHDPAGFRDCCHTCTYFMHEKCVAPAGFGFFPRVMLRIYNEA